MNTILTRKSHLKEKDLQYYEDLEKKEEEKILKRNERKQKREEKRNVSKLGYMSSLPIKLI